MGDCLGAPPCLSTATTHAIRLYLRNMTFQHVPISQEETIKEIEKIVLEDPGSNWLSHLTVFLNLDIYELDQSKNSLDYFALVNLDWEPVSQKFYVELIFRCRWHKFFLQTLITARKFTFPCEILEIIVSKMLSSPELEELFLTKEEWLQYMSVLPRIVAADDVVEGRKDKYMNLWIKLCEGFLQLPKKQMPVLSKVEVFIRLVGIISTRPEDYEGCSEISDSIKELSFDPLHENPRCELRTLAELFKSAQVDVRMIACHAFVFQTLQQMLLGMTFDPDEEGSKIFLKTKTRVSKKISKILTYIGDCAYLTNLIAKKNILAPSETPPAITSSVKEIQTVINFLEVFKSKSRYEDYEERTMTFDQFCTLLCSNVKFRHSQSSWYQKFFTFEEALTSQGCTMTKELIAPNVDLDLGFKVLKRILRMERPLSEEVKEVALTLIFNSQMYPDFEHLVDHIFKPGTAHDCLCTKQFQDHLNHIDNRLGSKETFCRQTQKLSDQMILDCRLVVLQNPVIATSRLLLRLLYVPECAQHMFKCLMSFWKLKVPQEKKTENELTQATASAGLFVHCVEQLLFHVSGPHEKNLHQKFLKFLPVLLKGSIISKEDLQRMISEIIVGYIGTLPTHSLISLLEIYKTLVVHVIQLTQENEDFFEDAFLFTNGLREATYFSSLESFAVRDETIEISNILSRRKQNELSVQLCPDILTSLESLNVVQLILLYARETSWVDVIKNYLGSVEGKAKIEEATLKDIENVIVASSSKEWLYVLELLFFITSNQDCSPQGALKKFMALVAKVPLFEVEERTNHMVIEDENVKSRKNKSSLDSVNSYPTVFQRFGSHLVDVLIKSGNDLSDLFLQAPEEQLELVKTLVAVACTFPDEPQYFSAKQVTVLALLDLATWLVNGRMCDAVREKCFLASLALKQSPQGNLAPMCISVVDVFNPKKPISMPSKSD